MTVSVILPTYNGATRLPVVLQSLREQVFSDLELIVSVDGSTDETKAVLEQWLPKFPAAKAVFSENGGRAVARNRGASAASGELLIFIDDDMRLAPDCLLQHIRHHEKIPASLVSGAQLYDPDTALSDFDHYKAVISENWIRAIRGIYPQPLPADQLHLTAANFSIPKSLFEKLGGFDERVTDAEDFLLAYTALEHGIPVYYLHAALGWHDDHAGLLAMQRRYTHYRSAARQLAALYPELPKRYPRYHIASVGGTKGRLYRLFSSPVWIRLIENNRFLPQRWRYRLYGVLLHAAARN
jgi:glycosyltransferase involved in cell wall biosynthesis